MSNARGDPAYVGGENITFPSINSQQSFSELCSASSAIEYSFTAGVFFDFISSEAGGSAAGVGTASPMTPRGRCNFGIDEIAGCGAGEILLYESIRRTSSEMIRMLCSVAGVLRITIDWSG